MTDDERLKKWTIMIERHLATGQPVAKWCKDNKVCISNYYKWRKRIKSNDASNEYHTFIPVTLDKAITEDITIEVNGIKICFEPQLLSNVIKALT